MDSLSQDKLTKFHIQAIFSAQRDQAASVAQTTAAQRIEKLKQLRAYILNHLDDIQNALYADFKKPASEVLIGEISALTGELNHTIKHLKQWMKPQRVPTTLSFVGTSSQIYYEPKGVVLIISPWNYPFALAIKPLISAIAAGNVAVIKPSELTPHTSAEIRKMLEFLFPKEEVAVVEGDAEVAQVLLELPFNHIFFTGSTAVGKLVMAAAAKHLASVTLELGGKSPCIVDQTADVRATAQRVAWGKCINNGQTCIAPDYLLVHQSVKGPFMEAYQQAIQQMYNPDGKGIEASESYARIVNQRHYQRLRALLDDALSKGARITQGGMTNEADCFVEPTVLENVNDSMQLMQEEIFGPLLPVIPYETKEDVIQHISQRGKPLALYIHSRHEPTIQYFLKNTTAGDTVINEVLMHFANPELPFGGVNGSGIGKSNGFFGFQEFSNARGVMRRQFGTLKFIYPPYTAKVKKLIGYMTRYL
ncbi:aldehyde dehydrogenase family protein [Tellurirhabdus bombi]|uniref:aldehyde dehydrogenase family protein n=1 Tax=Tellurirhabdus bombi TaxID=2907205 RepID=UPI001F38BB23|nr:aldehyde dehydrogenase family protein [Tellurirhabdus bombi]